MVKITNNCGSFGHDSPGESVLPLTHSLVSIVDAHVVCHARETDQMEYVHDVLAL